MHLGADFSRNKFNPLMKYNKPPKIAFNKQIPITRNTKLIVGAATISLGFFGSAYHYWNKKKFLSCDIDEQKSFLTISSKPK